MLAFSTSGSLSACHTVWRGAWIRRSPVMSIGPDSRCARRTLLAGSGACNRGRTRLQCMPRAICRSGPRPGRAGIDGACCCPIVRAALLAPADGGGGARLERRAAGAAGGRASGPRRGGCAVRGMRMLIDYLPFVTLLLALYTAGGACCCAAARRARRPATRRCWRSAWRWAGVMGTTGASMVLIHPLLRANAHRRRKVHLVRVLHRAGRQCRGRD